MQSKALCKWSSGFPSNQSQSPDKDGKPWKATSALSSLTLFQSHWPRWVSHRALPEMLFLQIAAQLRYFSQALAQGLNTDNFHEHNTEMVCPRDYSPPPPPRCSALPLPQSGTPWFPRSAVQKLHEAGAFFSCHCNPSSWNITWYISGAQ